MALLNSVTKVVAKALPSTISPKAHAMVDFITVGTFVAAAALFWRRNKRAAVAALICGGADLAVSLLTDYPGGVNRVISYAAHRDIDLGLAGLFATMPDFLAFQEDREKNFFALQGAAITALAEVTNFPPVEDEEQLHSGRAKAA